MKKDFDFVPLRKPVYIVHEPKFSNIGSANLNCPHCNGYLTRFPQRKTKCPYCDRIIYSRSRPLDRKKVLLNDEESEIVEKEWIEFNKFQHLTRIISAIIPENVDAILSEAYEELRSSLQKEPTIGEMLWEINKKKSEQSLKAGMFFQFRYHVLFSSDILKYEDQDLESLRYLLQVIYLDMNGITNTGNSKSKKAFTLKTASMSLNLLGEIRAVRIKLGIDMDQVKAEFVQSAADVSDIMKPWTPPLTPDEIWVQIARIIE